MTVSGADIRGRELAFARLRGKLLSVGENSEEGTTIARFLGGTVAVHFPHAFGRSP